jgi:hypothetical protein
LPDNAVGMRGALFGGPDVTPYRKFTDILQSEVCIVTTPKLAKPPKADVSGPSRTRTLDGLGALGVAASKSHPATVHSTGNRTDARWDEVEEERAAIVEYDCGVAREWAEALARLDPSTAPGRISLERWQRFIDDCGRFLDDGWAARAAAFGWGPLHLFGCDQKRWYARLDHKGLLWEVNGGRVVELHRDRAIIERPGGPQCYRRRPLDVGCVVLAWDWR